MEDFFDEEKDSVSFKVTWLDLAKVKVIKRMMPRESIFLVLFLVFIRIKAVLR